MSQQAKKAPEVILDIKIFMPHNGLTKAFRFSQYVTSSLILSFLVFRTLTVEQATQEVMDKVNITGDVGEYGLFAPLHQETGKKAHWLAKDKTFKTLGITTNVCCDSMFNIMSSVTFLIFSVYLGLQETNSTIESFISGWFCQDYCH